MTAGNFKAMAHRSQGWWAPMHPTPGYRLIARESAGLMLIPRTILSPRTAT